MARKAVIFGGGLFAEVVAFYLEKDSAYEVVAFTATDVTNEKTLLERPVANFEVVQEQYPPDEHDMFVAVGYRKMNKLRQDFCEEARAKGYTLLSYVCSKANILRCLSALEAVLRRNGFEVPPGEGVDAAYKVFEQ